MRGKGRSALGTVVAMVVVLVSLLRGPAGAAAAGGEADFVGLTPCRLVDTRGEGFGGPFGPPALAAGIPRDFPLQGQCGIPATAVAVSLNVTATTTLGPGFFLLYPQGEAQPLVSTLNYVEGQTVANAAIVPLGAGGLTVVAGAAGADLILDVDGYFEDSLVHDVGVDNTFVGLGAGNLGTTGQQNTGVGANALQSIAAGLGNTAVGFNALQSNTTGSTGTAVGFKALQGNTTGGNNTATGRLALSTNTTGGNNTATGADALRDNTTGSFNTATGVGALGLNSTGKFNTAMGNSALVSNATGDSNTAVGQSALNENTTGERNTAVGRDALVESTGSRNVALGFEAGVNATTGSDNIYIAHPGVAAESATTRVGTAGTQTRTFIAGISGVNVGAQPAVLVNASGQLGVNTSSMRVKEAIEPMREASQGLGRLRPVTFRYREAAADGTRPRQYGLIAEEVAEVYPDLVAYGPDGQPETVLYHVLPALLLNELQRQERALGAQAAEIATLRRDQAALQAQLGRLTEALSRLPGAGAVVPAGRP